MPRSFRSLMPTFASVALAFGTLAAPVASAQPATPQVRSVSISPDFQKKLEKDYGLKEAAILQGDLKRTVNRALAKAAGSHVTWVDLVIDDAKPSKPTFEQLTKNTSLSYADSYSLGGAKIQATLFDANGTPAGTITHAFYESDLQHSWAVGTWSDADSAFLGAASKIRKAAAPKS